MQFAICTMTLSHDSCNSRIFVLEHRCNLESCATQGYCAVWSTIKLRTTRTHEDCDWCGMNRDGIPDDLQQPHIGFGDSVQHEGPIHDDRTGVRLL